jgi:hypothetical protein
MKAKRGFLFVSVAVLAAFVGKVLADEIQMSTTLPAMPKPKIGTDEILFTTSVGSFKILGSDAAPATGQMVLNINGTVLVSGLEGTVRTEGLSKEFENKEFGKEAYFGTGKLIVNGKVRSIQAFGRKINGTFKGSGLVRLYGEFDKNLETGWVNYKGAEREPWGTSGNVKVVPQQIYNSSSNVKVKDSE